MPPQIPLGDVRLAGVRAWIRQGWFFAMVAASAIGFVGYLLPAHLVEGDEGWHSHYHDGGALPLMVFGAIAILALVLRKRGLGSGMALGVMSPIAAILTVLPLAISHERDLQQGMGEPVFGIGVTGLFLGGAIFVLVEPILFLTQRHANARAAAPQLPTARIHS